MNDKPAPVDLPIGEDTMSSALPDAVNYHRWVLEWMLPWVGPGPLLEVGPGYGQYTRELAPRVSRLVAVDRDPGFVERLSGSAGNVETICADVCDARFVDLVGAASFETLVCLNVLEHLPDDVAVLKGFAQALRPGGRVILLVPAHPGLYGPMDRLAGHCRRYTRGLLVPQLSGAGLSLERIEYFNGLGGLGWWVNAKLVRPRGLSDPKINRQILLYDRLVQPMAKVLNPLTRGFFGQSLWAVARRPS